MRRAAISLCFAVVALAQQHHPEKRMTTDEIQLRAKVNAIVPLQDFSGSVLPVDIDPRFALTVIVVSAVPTIDELKPRAVVTFAIHSPEIVFAGDATKGRTYTFSLCRESENGNVRFRGLGVRLAQGASVGGCG